MLLKKIMKSSLIPISIVIIFTMNINLTHNKKNYPNCVVDCNTIVGSSNFFLFFLRYT